MIKLKKIFMNIIHKISNKFQLEILIYFTNLVLTNDKKMMVKSVKYLDLAMLNRRVISPELLTKTFFPNYSFTKVSYSNDIISPEVQLVILDDCIVSGCSSSFIKGKDLMIERFCNEENVNAHYNAGGLLSHQDSYAVVRQSNLNYIENGFFLGGNGAWNYYHWLIEILPKLQTYLDLCLYKKSIKLILPDTVKQNKNFQFLLKSILGDIKVDMVFVSRSFSLKVEKMYHLTPINNILFNERIIGVCINPLHLRYDSLDFIRSKITDFIYPNIINNKEIINVERIFLARKKTRQRDYNQAQIISLLLKYKFKIVYMEEYDINEQVYLFENAKYIVGPSGAAWTNLIFSKGPCKALTWLPEIVKNFPVFASLADYANVDLYFFNTLSNNYKKVHDNYIIDLELFERKINRLLA